MATTDPLTATLPERHVVAPARAHQWVVTLANETVYDDLLVPFLGSLISIARWEGSIAIFDYGLTPKQVNRLRSFGLVIEPCDHKSDIVTVDRFFLLHDFVKRHEGIVGHWDCDIWFPGAISDLFDDYPARYAGRLVCNLDHVFQPSNFNVARDEKGLEELRAMLDSIIEKHGNLLQCGYFCGSSEAVRGYCQYLEDFIEHGNVNVCWNTDTVALNYYYFHQPGRFAVIDNKYNFLPDCLPRPLPEDFRPDAHGIRGFHVTSPWRAGEEGRPFRFETWHPKLYARWLEHLRP
jgi:hypothetical protein